MASGRSADSARCVGVVAASAGINNGPFGGGSSGSVFASPFKAASAASPDFFNLASQPRSYSNTRNSNNYFANANTPGSVNAYPGGTNAYSSGNAVGDINTPPQQNSRGQGQNNPQPGTISAETWKQNPNNPKQSPGSPNRNLQNPKQLPSSPNQYPNNLKQLPTNLSQYPNNVKQLPTNPSQYPSVAKAPPAGNQILEGFSSFPTQTSLFTGTLGSPGSTGSQTSRTQLGDFFFQGQDKNPAADLLETGLFGTRDYGEGNGKYNPYQEFLGLDDGSQPALPSTSSPYYGDSNSDYYGDDYYNDNYSDYAPGPYAGNDKNDPTHDTNSRDYNSVAYDDRVDYPADAGYDDRVPNDSSPAYDTEGGRYLDEDNYRPSRGRAEDSYSSYNGSSPASDSDSFSAGSVPGYPAGTDYGDSRDYPVATSYSDTDPGSSTYDVKVQSQSDPTKTPYEGPSYDYDPSETTASDPSDGYDGILASQPTHGYNPSVDGRSDLREVTYHETPSTQTLSTSKPTQPSINTSHPGNDNNAVPSGAVSGFSREPRDPLSDPSRNPSYPSSDPSTNPSQVFSGPSQLSSGFSPSSSPDDGPASTGYSDMEPFVYDGGFVSGISAVDSVDTPAGTLGSYTSVPSSSSSSGNSEPNYPVRSTSDGEYDTPQPVELPPRLQRR